MKLPTNEKKGITVRIDAKLHAEIRQYLEEHEMTMAEFITLAVQDELHPKLNIQESKYMGNMRTLAFQVPEELFQQIKDYLHRNNMSQKQFIIGLIENEIQRDLAHLTIRNEVQNDFNEHTEQQETATVRDCERISDEGEEQYEEQESTEISDDFDGEEEESLSEDEELDDTERLVENEEQGEDQSDEQDETEDIGLSMNM